MCATCKDLTPTLSKGEGADAAMMKEAERIANLIYKGKFKGVIDKKLTKLVAKKLLEAVKEGWKDVVTIAADDADYELAKSLEKNIYHFSAAKNYQQLKSMSLALKDEHGGIKTFKAFRDEAMLIAEEFLGNYLQVEYDTAVGSAQMAAKWQQFEKDKDVVNMLRYVTAGDARVRPAHRKLDNVQREVDDSFWNYYYPPNGWNCRCDVIAIVGGARTEKIELPDDDEVPALFRTNMGKEGIAFPNGHAYYKNISRDVLKAGEDLIDAK